MSKSSTPLRWVYAVCATSSLVVLAAILLALSLGGKNHLAESAGSPVSFSQPAGSSIHTPSRVAAVYAALPLAFERNQGQSDAQVQYLARGSGYTVFLTATDAVFSFQSPAPREPLRARRLAMQSGTEARPADQNTSPAVVRMQLRGAAPLTRPVPTGVLPGKSNYFIGNNPSAWHTDVARYERVSYQDVYPGVNLAFHGAQRQLEFDFVVAPGASPAPIGFHLAGARGMRTDDSGNLIVSSAASDVLLHKPVAYQEQNGARQTVDARFTLNANNDVSFALGNYDPRRELVIDPTVTYSTYLGGTGDDEAEAIAFDSSGNAYVTGQTTSTDFPTAGGILPNTNPGGIFVFVTKISADGSTLAYSTYIGGTGAQNQGFGIAVDSSGDAFVAGGTGSSTFPTTAGAFQTAQGGGQDAFALEINPNGDALTYSTYLGGSGNDVAFALALDSDGSVFVGGFTASADFKTLNPKQPALNGTNNGFVTKVKPDGSGLVYSTYLGGGTGDSVFAIALDGSHDAYVTGIATNPNFPITQGAFQTTCTCTTSSDAFVTVYNDTGSNYIYSTFLGGSGDDVGNGIAVNPAGSAYVTGSTASSDFPGVVASTVQSVYGGNTDAFVAKFKVDGSTLFFATYLGGAQADQGAGIAIDGNNNIYVTGQTSSADFPIVTPAVQGANGGSSDAFVSEITSGGGQLSFSTYLGGSADEDNGGNFGAIAVNSTGANIYVAGNTGSANFPTTSPFQATKAGGHDAYVVKYTQPGTNPASYTIAATTPSAVSPGSSGTSTVTLTSVNNYGSPVALSCSVTGTGSPLPGCGASGFSTNPVTPTAGGVTSTLTITTTPPHSAMVLPARLFYAMWLPIAGIALTGMGLGTSSSRRKKAISFLMLATVLFALALLPACGGGGGGGGGGGPTGGTPAGSYTVTITGVGNDAGTTTKSATVTLTVN